MKICLLIGLISTFGLGLRTQAQDTQDTFDHSHAALTAVLKTYVNDAGMVNYAKLKSNRGELDAYIGQNSAISKSIFDGWSQEQQLAFLINVYNSETLKLIINHLPIKSIKDIGGRFRSPWKTKSVELFGETTTLDHVEHGILRTNYNEPRIHFALVCAAIGCPPLRNEAFTPDALEAQLDDQAKVFLSQTEKNRLDGNKLYLTPIFKWFAKDFTKNGKSISEYVDPYMEGSTSGKSISYTDYSWSLNKQ